MNHKSASGAFIARRQLTVRRTDPPAGVNATQFIVWFEPERVTSGSYIYEHFPSHVLGRDIDVGGGVLTDLGNEHMRDYVVEYLSAAVDEYQLDVLRIDFNMPALPAWRCVCLSHARGVV